MSDKKHMQTGRVIEKGPLAGYIDFGKLLANNPKAKLMLAAPDLLKACKEALEWVKEMREEPGAMDSIGRMNAAITKAEGGAK